MTCGVSRLMILVCVAGWAISDTQARVTAPTRVQIEVRRGGGFRWKRRASFSHARTVIIYAPELVDQLISDSAAAVPSVQTRRPAR
jgi:hypothetical protein